MNVIVLQHADAEHPGVFRDFFRDDGFQLHTVKLNQGEPIPDLNPFDIMLVMGGPQDVWQEDEYPWFRPEKEAIRTFVTELKRPYLGICLGHQLLADALGGRVSPARSPEIGVMPVSKTKEGEIDRVLAGISNPLRVLQWHGAEVSALPKEGVTLASSNACKIQALRVGQAAYGFQFHIEITSRTVTDWAAIPDYVQALQGAMGSDGMEQLKAQVDREIDRFNRDARVLYEGLKQTWTAQTSR
jgi:GMP synthase-like glutamine amidotransferase